MDEHDVIVIGLGPGGEEVASRAAAGGLDVLGVDRKLLGGECAYWGCVPTKTIVRAGFSLAEAGRARRLAGELDIRPDWSQVAGRVREVTADWDDEIAVKRHEDNGETFVRGAARIVAPGEVEIDGRSYRARRAIVIATGTDPAVPSIEGIDQIEYWTNRDAVEAKELPRSLVILGAGPVGLELGQTFARFGTEVTLVELFEHALAYDEPEIGRAVEDVLKEEGIGIRCGAGARSVRRVDEGVEVSLDDGTTLRGERFLVATGRRSNLGALGLENVGLDPSARRIRVDENLRAAEGVWAIGDITPDGGFTHVAVYQGRIAAADILGRDHEPADYRAVPRVTFMDPEVASVGLTAKRAHEQGINVRTGIAPTSASTRGYIHGPGAEHGVMKLVADADAGVLVGASIMAPAAGEIIGLPALAIKERVPVRHLRDLIYPYPTFQRGLEGALTDLDL